ncbi:hypothetical protein P0Y35_16850 [Kiritimatiellaeota bacterium B1221]|nr:hypothetical protein [Kiritimatiellaeota bacterium B1221]
MSGPVMVDDPLQLLQVRLKALACKSDGLRNEIEQKVREAGLLQKYICHNQDAIWDFCRYYEEIRSAILDECEGVTFVTDRIEKWPVLTRKNYHRPREGSRLFTKIMHVFESDKSLRHFREKLRYISESCASILFVMRNPEVFHDL